MKIMKKVLLVYREASRNELNTLSNILVTQLQKLGINCEVETCSLFLSKEALYKGYDFIAGYKIDIQHELSLSQAFQGKYLHFFVDKYTFAFANVTKKKELGGYNMYKVSSAPVYAN